MLLKIKVEMRGPFLLLLKYTFAFFFTLCKACKKCDENMVLFFKYFFNVFFLRISFCKLFSFDTFLKIDHIYTYQNKDVFLLGNKIN